MDWRVVACVVVAVARVAWGEDGCSAIEDPDACVLRWGCQWCAAEELPAETARCRARPPAPDAWCALALVDPPEARVVPGDPADPAEASFRFSPKHISVDTRQGRFEINFLLKKKNDHGIKLFGKEPTSFYEQHFTFTIDQSRTKHVHEKLLNVTAEIDVVMCPEDSKLQLLVGTDGVNVPVELTLRCRAECPRRDEPAAAACSGSGTRHCGICLCNHDRIGLACELPNCNHVGNRGDMPICHASQCYGNGECDECDLCKCREPAELYYDDTCQGFCEPSRSCALCLHHYRDRDGCGEAASTAAAADFDSLPVECEGPCWQLCERAKMRKADDSEQDLEQNWTECSVAADGCMLHYSGRRRGDDRTLWLGNCTVDVVGGAGGVVSNELLVVGAGAGGSGSGAGGGKIAGAVLGALTLAAVVAAAAVLAWRAAHAPVDALAATQYEHMDAEANQGENPLYRPPVSSYANPLYLTNK